MWKTAVGPFLEMSGWEEEEEQPEAADVELGFLEPFDEDECHLNADRVQDWDGGRVGGRPVCTPSPFAFSSLP